MVTLTISMEILKFNIENIKFVDGIRNNERY